MMTPLFLRRLNGWRSARRMRRTGRIYGRDLAVSEPIGDPDEALLPAWAWGLMIGCAVVIVVGAIAVLALVVS